MRTNHAEKTHVGVRGQSSIPKVVRMLQVAMMNGLFGCLRGGCGVMDQCYVSSAI